MIMPRANRQKAIVPVKVTILKPDPVLRPDMSCKVAFLSKEDLARKSAPKVLVPQRAVLQLGDRTVVFVVQAGVAHAVPVTLGAKEGDRVQVQTGLSGGEDVVVSGLASVNDGTPVRVKGSS